MIRGSVFVQRLYGIRVSSLRGKNRNREAKKSCKLLWITLLQLFFLADRTRLELATPCVTGMYSNQTELPIRSLFERGKNTLFFIRYSSFSKKIFTTYLSVYQILLKFRLKISTSNRSNKGREVGKLCHLSYDLRRIHSYNYRCLRRRYSVQ